MKLNDLFLSQENDSLFFNSIDSLASNLNIKESDSLNNLLPEYKSKDSYLIHWDRFPSLFQSKTIRKLNNQVTKDDAAVLELSLEFRNIKTLATLIIKRIYKDTFIIGPNEFFHFEDLNRLIKQYLERLGAVILTNSPSQQCELWEILHSDEITVITSSEQWINLFSHTFNNSKSYTIPKPMTHGMDPPNSCSLLPRYVTIHLVIMVFCTSSLYKHRVH